VLQAENIKFIEMLCLPLELVVAYPIDISVKIVFSDRPSFRIFPSTIRHRFFESMGLVAD